MQAQQRIQKPQLNQFYLHENTPPLPAARRTWAQPATILNTDPPQNQVRKVETLLLVPEIFIKRSFFR